jgi:hypothetical protein
MSHLPSRRVRYFLAAMNFTVGGIMLVGLTFGTPDPTVVAIPFIIVVAASIVAVALER